MKFVKIDVKNKTFLTVGKRLLHGNGCSLDGGSGFLCLLLGHILRKKSVYYIYICRYVSVTRPFYISRRT